MMLDKFAFIIVIIHEHMHTYTWCTNLLFDWTIFEVIPIVLHNNSWSRIVMMWDWTRYCVFGDTIHYLSCKLCLQLDKGGIETVNMCQNKCITEGLKPITTSVLVLEHSILKSDKNTSLSTWKLNVCTSFWKKDLRTCI